MKKRLQCLFTSGLILLLISGCAATNKKSTAKDVQPPATPGHNLPPSHMGMKMGAFGTAPSAITPSSKSDDASSFNTAIIRVHDKQSNANRLIEVPFNGEKVNLEQDNNKLQIQVLNFYSDFALGEFGPTSRSNELRNPALRISITNGEEKLFLGYLFGKFPDQHNFDHERLKITLVNVLEK